MQQCKSCGVSIQDDIVYFSYGKPGTRARLKARVCQYAKDKTNCINQSFDGELTDKDRYGDSSIPPST